MDRTNKPSAVDEIVRAYTNGEAIRAWEFMGSHAQERDGQWGYTFRVWAPHAAEVSVVGDFNRWEGRPIPSLPSAGDCGRALSPVWIATTSISIPSAPKTAGPF